MRAGKPKTVTMPKSTAPIMPKMPKAKVAMAPVMAKPKAAPTFAAKKAIGLGKKFS